MIACKDEEKGKEEGLREEEEGDERGEDKSEMGGRGKVGLERGREMEKETERE